MVFSGIFRSSAREIIRFFGAMQRLMRQSSAKMLSARRECLVLAALLLLSPNQGAYANNASPAVRGISWSQIPSSRA
jgi:hypothetical protein